MVYAFGSIWSYLGYAAHCFGAVTVLARQLWSSSKWLYLVHHSFLLIAVSLEGEIVDVLKILRALFRTSSYSFLEL